MKFFSKFVMFVMLSFFALPIAVSAGSGEPNVEEMEATKNPHVFYDSKTEQYYDTRSEGYIGAVYKVENGTTTTVENIKEYVESEASVSPKVNKTTQMSSSTEEVSPLAGPTYYSRYNESSNVEQRHYGNRVSIIQENPGPGSDSYTLQYEKSKSNSFNIGLTSTQYDAISLGVGYSFVYSESIKSSHTLSLPAGYSGYFRFDPRMRKTRGTLYNYNSGVLMSTESVTGYYPVRQAGVLDGWLVAVKNPM